MNKPKDMQPDCKYLKLNGGNPRLLKPKTDCRYYHGSVLFDMANINKFSDCQILMTDF